MKIDISFYLDIDRSVLIWLIILGFLGISGVFLGQFFAPVIMRYFGF